MTLRRVNNANKGSLFPYYISKSISQFLLDILERYQILPELNSEVYHMNCFLYALRQEGVSEAVINTIKTHISNTHIKIIASTLSVRSLG